MRWLIMAADGKLSSGQIRSRYLPSGKKRLSIEPNFLQAREGISLLKKLIEEDKFAKKNPNDSTAYNNRAVARYELGDYKGAVKDYDKAISIDPDFAVAYYNRGKAKYAIGDHKGAIKDYDKAISIDPNYADAYTNRGLVKYAIGDYKGAIKDYDKAISINPNDAFAYTNRAVAKYNLGDSGKIQRTMTRR